MGAKCLTHMRQISIPRIRWDVDLVDHDEALNHGWDITYIERHYRTGKLTGKVGVVFPDRDNGDDVCELLLIYILADRALDENNGTVDYLQIKHLMYYMNRSESSVKRYLARLVWRGEIRRQVNNGKKRSNVYMITPGGLEMDEYEDLPRRKEHSKL